jgi:hypothetical protein
MLAWEKFIEVRFDMKIKEISLFTGFFRALLR